MKRYFSIDKIKNLAVRGAALIFTTLFLFSCHHKDIEFDIVNTQKVNVVFDWRNAPDANPSSMGVYFYYASSDLENNSILFEFPNKTGGEIKVPVGSFSGIAFNTDNTDWVELKNEESIEDFEISTHKVSSLAKTGLITRSLPRPIEAVSEPMAETPGMVWSARNDGMTLSQDEKSKTFIFYPDEAVCHYTVDVENVGSIESIEGSGADGTISGMAGGYSHGKRRPSTSKVTHPFLLSKVASDNSLHAEFLTFGEPSENKGDHYLSLYLVLNDGQKKYFEYDVTDQIRNAKDPRHVYIRVQGPKLPKNLPNEGGLIPDVDDWDYENIDLKM